MTPLTKFKKHKSRGRIDLKYASEVYCKSKTELTHSYKSNPEFIAVHLWLKYDCAVTEIHMNRIFFYPKC